MEGPAVSLVDPEQNEELQTPALSPRRPVIQPAPPGKDMSSRYDIAVNLSMPLLLLDDADTLVYVDPVPATSERSCATASIPHRVHSQRLLETGSEFFRKLFQPRVQQRVIKRRGLTDKLPLHIKYVLDLTPPSVEEEAVVYLTELSCPLGIRTWAQFMQRWVLPKSCVGGVDETEWVEDVSGMGAKANLPGSSVPSTERFVGVSESSVVDHVSEAVRRVQLEQEGWSVNGSAHTKMLRAGLPLDYSPTRHRTGVDRILHALEGLHPKLDTACKMWTFFALAKIFDVATAPQICDHILSWLYELSNCRFVEVNPEIAFNIACGIKCSYLCRDTFAILVGEEALRLAGLPDAAAGTKRPAMTIHGRMRESLDDSEVQRIEYASRSFMDHVLGRFTYLVGSEMPWLSELPEFRRILDSATSSPSEQTAKDDLIRSLKTYIRGILYGALTARQLAVRGPGYPWPAEDQEHRQHLNDVYQTLRVAQRILTKTYWISLSQGWVWDNANFHLTARHSNVAAIAPELPLFQREANASIQPVTRQSVAARVETFNGLRRRRDRDVSLPVRTVTKGQDDPRPAIPPVYAGPPDYDEEELRSVASPDHVSLFGRDAEESNALSTRAETPPLMFGFEVARQLRLAQTRVLATPNVQEQASCAVSSGISVKDNDSDSDAFRLDRFRAQVDEYVGRFAMEMLQSPESEEQMHRLTLGRDDTLTCLTTSEFKFLPLWAGGNDDGSGGVFIDQEVPIVESGGFSGPGPAIYTASSAAGSAASTVGGSFSVIDGSEYNSTVHGASHHATDGFTGSEIRSIDSVVDHASETDQIHDLNPELDGTSPPQWAELESAYDDVLSDASDTAGNRSVDEFFSDGEDVDTGPLYSDDQDFHDNSDDWEVHDSNDHL